MDEPDHCQEVLESGLRAKLKSSAVRENSKLDLEQEMIQIPERQTHEWAGS